MKTVYIKLTNSCQLKCDHCYNDVCPAAATMTPETLKKVEARLENLIKLGNSVMATFHGGEPFIVDKQLIKQAVEMVDRLLQKYPGKISFSATSNLVFPINVYLLQLIMMFEKNENGKVILSTSWDKNIRFSSKEQEAQWSQNVTLLNKLGVDVRPIVTVTKVLIDSVPPEEVVTYMKSLGCTTMNFERITCTGRAEIYKKVLIPTNKEMREWLFKAYLAAKELDMSVPLFDLLEKSVKHGKLEGCRARQCVKNVITFNPEGTIATCPNMGDKIVGTLADIVTSDIKPTDILAAQLHATEQIRDSRCYYCEHYKECNGDCFQLRWDDTGCPGLPEIIRYIKEG